jgi:hypothetical protein
VRAQSEVSTSGGGQASVHGIEGLNVGQIADISDLASIQITMTLEQLFRLVPRFSDGIRCTLGGATQTKATMLQLTEVNPWVMDCDCPSLEAILGGQPINVINLAICQQLGIIKWEPCTFWLRMTDGSSVRPIGIIPDLEMVVQGHAFTILIVIMDLPGKEAYPLVLERPWLRSAMMKHDWQKNAFIF